MGRRFPRWWTSAAAREAGTRLRRRLFRRRFLGRVDRVVKREGEGGREREMVASPRPSLLLYSFLFRKSSNRKSIKHLRLLKTGVSRPTG